MLTLNVNNSTSTKVYNSDTMITNPDIEMGLDFMKLQHTDETVQNTNQQLQKGYISLFVKIMNYLKGE